MENETAEQLIERLERETGQRLDTSDPDNLVVAGLFGAMSRALGKSPPSYKPRDDVVAGMMIRHQMSPEGRRQKAADDALADLLSSGVPPDVIAALAGKRNP